MAPALMARFSDAGPDGLGRGRRRRRRRRWPAPGRTLGHRGHEQAGQAERGEADGQRPAQGVTGRADEPDQAAQAAWAEPLGVGRGQAEVAGAPGRGRRTAARAARATRSACSSAHSAQVGEQGVRRGGLGRGQVRVARRAARRPGRGRAWRGPVRAWACVRSSRSCDGRRAAPVPRPTAPPRHHRITAPAADDEQAAADGEERARQDDDREPRRVVRDRRCRRSAARAAGPRRSSPIRSRSPAGSRRRPRPRAPSRGASRPWGPASRRAAAGQRQDAGAVVRSRPARPRVVKPMASGRLRVSRDDPTRPSQRRRPRGRRRSASAALSVKSRVRRGVAIVGRARRQGDAGRRAGGRTRCRRPAGRGRGPCRRPGRPAGPPGRR